MGLDGGPGDKGSTNFDVSLFTYSNPYEVSPNIPESQKVTIASEEYRSHNLAVVNGNGFGRKEIERSVKSNQSGSPGSPRSRSRVNIEADLLEAKSNDDALPQASRRSSPNDGYGDGVEDGDGQARKPGHKGKPKSSGSINKNGKAGGGGKKSHQDARPLGPMTDYTKHSIKNIVHYSSK